MTTTATLSGQGQPPFAIFWQAAFEAAAGNGVQSKTDLEVTAGSGSLEVDIATGTGVYETTTATLSSSTTKTLSSGGSDDRWDTIAFDVGTGSVTVRQGTGASNPTPPDLQADEVLLAVVYVAANATSIGSSDIVNWRGVAQEAGEVRYDDSTGQFSVSDVDSALDELQEAAQLGAYPLASADIATDAVGSDELDQSVAYTFTATQSFDDGSVALSIGDQAADPTANGEVTRNGTDVKIYSGGSVRNVSNIGSGGGSPGGSDTQLQYNNSGSFGGISDFTYDGTNLSSITDIDDTLALLDQAADPSANGEMQLNGTDVKVFSGGSVKNISNIGGGSTDVSDDGSTVVSETDDINFASGGEVTDDTDGTVTVDISEPFVYDPGMTNFASGLSDAEINRIALQSGETLVVERIEFRQQGGGSSTSADIDVRDTTAATTIGSQNLGGTTKDPGSSGSGNTVIVRVTNSTGSAIDAAPRVIGRIEGA